jgi:polyvinyl alcohol dehydrogenase (cytochrome)
MSISSKLFIASTLLFAALAADTAGGQGRGGRGGPPGGALFGAGFNAQQTFEQACASCHTAEGKAIGDRQAHSVATLRDMPTERVYQAIATGSMAVHSANLVDRDRRALASFVSGKPFVDATGLGLGRMTNACSTNPPLGNLSASRSWLGWSAAGTNARFQPAAAAGLTAAEVPKLRLKWAFGIPGGGIMSGQPTVAFGRVFVASDNNMVYALDAKSGCAYWAFNAESSGRFAPVVGPISGHAGSTYAVFFTTGPGHTFAVDAHTGKQLWKTSLSNRVTNRDGSTRELNNVSASVAHHDGRIYVPFAGTETFYNPTAECCRSRGGLAALDANTGKQIWRVDTIPEPAAQTGVTATGVPIWGKSGASVWNTPTIDATRRLVYVGTGNSYGPIAADTSDSIIAYSMADGRIAWYHQEFKGDSFMASFGAGGCGQTNPPGGACPQRMGPDWDFGGSSAILITLPTGRDVVLAAGKGGVAIALDPDANGKVIWRTPLFTGQPPSALGLVLWGGASDGQRVYYALQRQGGGLSALDVLTGRIEWTADVKADNRGQSGAVSAIPGIAFTGGWDGILRAVDSGGSVVWTFNTQTAFPTVNGVPGKGGSLGVGGAAIADGTVYIASGYNGIQNGAGGNVLLAFAPQ